MLEWLKNILGDSYSEDIDKKVSLEIGKAFVSKVDFNTKNEACKEFGKQIAERDRQLEELKKVDSAGLQAEITRLQGENATAKTAFETQIAELKLSYAVENALTNAKAKNSKAVKALLDESKLKLNDDGTVAGLAEQLSALQSGADTGFLFEVADANKPGIRGYKPPEGSGETSKTPDQMNYEELCAYLTANPNAQL